MCISVYWQARHSLGVLNANLQYMYIYIFGGTYVTTFISAGTPLRKGGGVRPQSFLGQQREWS